MSRQALALALAAIALCAAEAAAQRSKMSTAQKSRTITANVRYVGYKKGQAWGRPCLVLIVQTAKGRKTDLTVPNRNPMAFKLDPAPQVAELVQRLTPGDIVQVRYGPFKGRNMLNMIKPVKLKADEPPYFTVVKTDTKKFGIQEHLYIVLSKGDQQAEVLVPNVRGEEGKWTPDPKIAEQVRKFKHGDHVDVEARKVGSRMYLKAIYPYAEPVVAQFVKTETREFDGRKHVCVLVSFDGLDDVILLPNTGKGAAPSPDRALLTFVKRLRPGQKIQMTLQQDGEKSLLRKIAPAPAKPRPKKK